MGDLEKSMRSNKYISFKAGNKIKMDDEKHLFEKEEMEITAPTCCRQQIKVDLLNLNIGVYCPFCGVQE
jgi:hypothetical protein